MKKNLLVMLTCSALVLSSCVQSLYPLTENKNQIVFNPELLGQWKENDGTEYLVDSSNDKVYHVAIIDHRPGSGISDTSYFLMTIVSINGKYFLDCVPDTTQGLIQRLGEQALNFTIPVHNILKLNSITKNSVEIGSIDNDQVLKLMQQKKFSIKYEPVDKDRTLLLEKPENLQQKLTELERFPMAYEKDILQRK
jgi:hypothetical protein